MHTSATICQHYGPAFKELGYFYIHAEEWLAIQSFASLSLLPLSFISLHFTAVHCTALYFASLNLIDSPRFTSLWVYVLIRLIFTDPWERSAVLHSHSITGVHQLMVGSTEGAVFFLDIKLPCCLLQAVLTMRSFWQQQSI